MSGRSSVAAASGFAGSAARQTAAPKAALRHAGSSEAVLPSAISSVEVFHAIAPVESAWAELEAVAPASAYQTRAFLIPWLETIGQSHGMTPYFVLGRDARGGPIALLCLGIQQQGLFRVAEFLGGREANFHLGLFDPQVALGKADLRRLLREAAKRAGRAAPHCYVLCNQPVCFAGQANPLGFLPHQLSPSFAYATQLAGEGDSFIAEKLSKETRKKLRKKEARLKDIGALTLVSNDTPAAAQTLVDAFFAEKIARGATKDYADQFSNPAVRAFFERLALPRQNAPAWLEFHGLALDDRIIATYAGAVHRNHFSCLVNSFEADPEIAKSSPGELLLMRLIAQQCDMGRQVFDLGIGEARYKAAYCDETISLVDVIVPVGLIGRLFGVFRRIELRIKRFIKRDPALLAGALRLRQMLRRRGRG